ncbi:MAG: hypothetical protein VW907_02260 [Opitutae bacterium]
MMYDSDSIEDDLYEQAPDKLYTSRDRQTWYACYDDELCLLTNAGGELKAYCYDSKPEYRDIRSKIIEAYNLRRSKVIEYEEY